MTDTATPPAARDGTADADGYHPVRIAAVRRETADTVSLLLDIPPALADRFAYHAGQYVTLRVVVDGRPLVRCYSMSSMPGEPMRITIRRLPDGRVSRWAAGAARAGDVIDVMAPAGRFCLRETDAPLMLYAGGSGITPILSLAKAALADTARRVTLLHAHRTADTVIFADEIAALAAGAGDRLTVIGWIDAARGMIDAAGIAALAPPAPCADHYICGPDAFMETIESLALAAGVSREHLFIERFVSPPDETPAPSAADVADGAPCESLTILLRGARHDVDYQPGETIVQAAFRAGLRPPISCLSGACATCMAKLSEGSVHMHANDVLTPQEVAAGYVLTCQSVPTARAVTVAYED